MKLFLITGISGYVGSMLAVNIAQAGGDCPKSIKVLGICRDIKKAGDKLEKLADTGVLGLIECDLIDVNAGEIISGELDDCSGDTELYIIHCASITASKTMVEDPVLVADGIIFGTKLMLNIASKYKAKSFEYVPSMDAYGTVPDIGRPRYEDELGDIDLKPNRSCYPMAKRIAEHYCHIFHNQYTVPVKIVRLAQTFGLGADKNDPRVFMQFTKAVLEDTL